MNSINKRVSRKNPWYGYVVCYILEDGSKGRLNSKGRTEEEALAKARKKLDEDGITNISLLFKLGTRTESK